MANCQLIWVVDGTEVACHSFWRIWLPLMGANDCSFHAYHQFNSKHCSYATEHQIRHAPPPWKFPGSHPNIKMSSYQYRKSDCRDKTILRPSYLHNGISNTGNMTSLYWIRVQIMCIWMMTVFVCGCKTNVLCMQNMESWVVVFIASIAIFPWQRMTYMSYILAVSIQKVWWKSQVTEIK